MMNKVDTITHAELVLKYLQQKDIQIDVQSVYETGSTNTDLVTALPSLTQPVVRIAEIQTAGKGRAGRKWQTPSKAGMAMSIAFPVAHKHQALSSLSLAIGVALVEAFRALDINVDIKWPNDILRHGDKLAGILIEAAKHPVTGKNWVVVGVGINLDLPDTFQTMMGRTFANASELLEKHREEIYAHFIAHMVTALKQFNINGFSSFYQRWNQYHAYQHQRVVLMNQNVVQKEGIAMGIDENGMFLMQTANGIEHIAVGDISLRLHEAVKGDHAITH